MKENKAVTDLLEKRIKLSTEIEKIDSEVAELNKETILKELKSRVGKYYKLENTKQLFFFTGVDEDALQSTVIVIHEYKDNKNNKEKFAWYGFEIESFIYNFTELVPIKKSEFMLIFNKIKNVINNKLKV